MEKKIGNSRNLAREFCITYDHTPSGHFTRDAERREFDLCVSRSLRPTPSPASVYLFEYRFPGKCPTRSPTSRGFTAGSCPDSRIILRCRSDIVLLYCHHEITDRRRWAEWRVRVRAPMSHDRAKSIAVVLIEKKRKGKRKRLLFHRFDGMSCRNYIYINIFFLLIIVFPAKVPIFVFTAEISIPRAHLNVFG